MDTPADVYADSPATDAELARAVAAGDMGALAAIYDRYADRLHDYCWSVLRDRDEAADAVQEVFITAARRLGQLREPDKLRAWLYAVARHESLRRAGLRKRVTVTDDVPETATSDPSLDDAARRSELSTLVWNAAEGLADRDRAILDLHLRQGLEGQELGDALGVTASHAYVLVSRLRDSVARSLGAFLVARLGSEDCTDLARILEHWDGRFTPLIRKRVARHIDGCHICDERRRTCASPLALLSAAPILSAPALLRSRVFEQIRLVSDDTPLPPTQDASWRDDGFPAGLERRGRRGHGRRRFLVAAGLVAVLLAIGGAVDVVASGSSGGMAPAAASASRSPDANVPGSAATAAGPTPTSSTTSEREADSAGSGPGRRLLSSPTGAPPTAGPVTRSRSVTPDNGRGADVGTKTSGDGASGSQEPVLTVSASPATIETSGCKPSTSTVTLDISGGAAPSAVTLMASVPGSGSRTTSMTGGGGSGSWTYSATVGNALKPGQLTYRASERAADGHTSTSPTGSITVLACSGG